MSSNNITTYLDEGLEAALPASPAGTPSSDAVCFYYATDTMILRAWTGAAWVKVGWNLVPVANGGTGKTTLTAHGVLIGAGTAAINITSAGTSGQVLTSNGASADPTFQNVGTASIEFTDGTNTVSAATELAVVGGLISGSNPNATYTLPSLNVDAVTVSGSTQTLTPGTLIGKYAITLNHNVTFTMSGGTDGMVVLLALIQGSGGNFTVAFDSSVVFGTDITSFTASTTAALVDYVLLQYSGNLSKWCVMAVSHGF